MSLTDDARALWRKGAERGQQLKRTEQPYRCPVCEGSGLVPTGFYSSEFITGAIPGSETCRTCDGKGVIWR